MVDPSVQRSASWRSWAVWRNPRPVIGFVIGVNCAAIAASVLVWRSVPTDARSWVTALVMIVAALLFEEGSLRFARLKSRLGSQLKQEMTSVWSIAAAIALPPPLVVVVVVALFCYLWPRHQRPTGSVFHRMLSTHATILLATLAAATVLHAGSGLWQRLPWLVSGLVAAVVVMVVEETVNRGLISSVLMLSGVRGRDLLGSRDDNFVEIATLCLGGLVGAAVVYQPALCLLALPPMVTLRRGALVRELETAATTDSKTGLLNALAWEEVARRELSRAHRETQPLALLILDLDRFKLVNDRFGHLAGDEVLRGLGRVLESSIREYDTPGRFGGEEFVAVLPGADEAVALAVAERVRAHVAQFCVGDFVPAVADGPRVPLSASIGVACAAAGESADVPDLLYAADRALYEAKAGGRDRVCLAGREGGPTLDETVPVS